MFDLSPMHLLIVLAIALIVLGPKRLPDMARSLGHSLREFKGSLSDGLGNSAHAAASEPESVFDSHVSTSTDAPAQGS